MSFPIDLWTKLKDTHKPILIYGMGNGADKILGVLESRGIPVADFFASDGFVRGHLFHGKRVLSLSEAREKYGDFIILLAFGSHLPDVLANFDRLDREFEFYAPDVPIAGDELFDGSYYNAHKNELEEVRELLADDESKRVFDHVVDYRLSGSIRPLRDSFSDESSIWKEILRPERYRFCADLGAYTGDSIKTLLSHASHVEGIEAWEPDLRSYKKLCAYLESEGLVFVHPHHAGAWNADTTLTFSSEGNRNSSVYGVKRSVETEMLRVDSVYADRELDFLKMDVEGAEREAIEGAEQTIRRCRPDLQISLYHRSGDLFELPLTVHRLCPDYRLYLRRPEYVPAWDLCLYAIGQKN
ncbi:MAG: FkbM family methyltransferase [Eubacteriales bacterium]